MLRKTTRWAWLENIRCISLWSIPTSEDTYYRYYGNYTYNGPRSVWRISACDIVFRSGFQYNNKNLLVSVYIIWYYYISLIVILRTLYARLLRCVQISFDAVAAWCTCFIYYFILCFGIRCSYYRRSKLGNRISRGK